MIRLVENGCIECRSFGHCFSNGFNCSNVKKENITLEVKKEDRLHRLIVDILKGKTDFSQLWRGGK